MLSREAVCWPVPDQRGLPCGENLSMVAPASEGLSSGSKSIVWEEQMPQSVERDLSLSETQFISDC